jgi:hypothetical protein
MAGRVSTNDVVRGGGLGGVVQAATQACVQVAAQAGEAASKWPTLTSGWATWTQHFLPVVLFFASNGRLCEPGMVLRQGVGGF